MISREIINSLDQEIKKKWQEENVPGMALVLAQDGELVYEKYLGYRDVERKLPVTKETIFGVASITKSLTALGVMKLEDDGKLTVHDRVIDWLPELQAIEEKSMEEISIHHLLTHTAGFPGMTAVNKARAASIRDDPDGEYLFGSSVEASGTVQTVVEMIEVMKNSGYSPLGRPGEAFNYSNEAFALLQEIIERASGKSFMQFMIDAILRPAGMDRSFFSTGDLKGKEDVTELYAYKTGEKPAFFHSPSWWDVGKIYSNGSLKCSAGDLLKYMEIFRRGGVGENGRIVSAAAIEKMTAPHVTLPTGGHYGYGLQVSEEQGVEMFGHGGSIKGVSSHMKIVETQGLTAAVLMNIADAPAEKLVMTAIATVLGLSDEEVPEYPVEEEELEKYIGYFASDEGQSTEVVFTDGLLYLKQSDEFIPLKPYAPDSFTTLDGGKLKFLKDESGKVTAVFKGVRVIPKASLLENEI